MTSHTITTTNLSVVGSGPMWAPVQRGTKTKEDIDSCLERWTYSKGNKITGST